MPLLYSFRRCPYAIRARLAIYASGIKVELREIPLRDKPEHMLQLSAKGTVPVLQLPNGDVIDESIDVFYWALEINDPADWLVVDIDELAKLVKYNDGEFKHWLDRYKYSIGYPEHSVEYYRQQAELFIAELEQRLNTNQYLLGNKLSAADMAVLPFIRQFAFVDKAWFDSAPYPKVQRWLEDFLISSLFLTVMDKYSPWQAGDDVVWFS
ncbi:MAG: glutathione S-transferase [Pseudomonadales bacterium]|jgi:glutathione S-transferase